MASSGRDVPAPATRGLSRAAEEGQQEPFTTSQDRGAPSSCCPVSILHPLSPACNRHQPHSLLQHKGFPFPLEQSPRGPITGEA